MVAEAFTPTGPVTGDAVELEIKAANLGSRLVAQVIDMVVQVVLLVVLIYWLTNVVRVRGLDSSLSGALGIALFVGVLVGVPATLEGLTHGKSVGKYALGLRVVRDDHGTIRARQAIGRALIGFVEIWVTAGVAALITAALNKRGKRLGDMAMGTVVISERVPLRWAAAMPMPPMLAPWAMNADIAPLDPKVVLGARQYLMRRQQLSPQARARLSTHLADHLRAKVAPAPPLSTADDLIMAMIAERGRRDRERLARNEELRIRIFSG